MKVKDPYGEIVNVFHMYWNHKVILVGVLYPGQGGMNVYYLHEVEIIDPSFDYRTIFSQSNSMNRIAHWALIEKNLLDDVYEHVQSAYDEFLKILKEEGVVEQDFF